ncbi:MAG: FhaA domain-containing protein [Chloroflexota bacterium]
MEQPGAKQDRSAGPWGVPLIERIEQRIRGVAEGAAPRLLRLSPALDAVAMLVARHARRRRPGEDGPYVVRLHPADLDALRAKHAALEHSLERRVSAALRRDGVVPRQRVAVILQASTDVRRGDIRHVIHTRDEREPRASNTLAPTARLPVTRRLELVDSGGLRLALERPVTVLGRSSASDIVVSDQRVSRTHLTLRWVGHDLVIADLNSTNGTSVNGRPVASTSVYPGDEISAGGYRLWVRQVESTARA